MGGLSATELPTHHLGLQLEAWMVGPYVARLPGLAVIQHWARRVLCREEQQLAPWCWVPQPAARCLELKPPRQGQRHSVILC